MYLPLKILAVILFAFGLTSCAVYTFRDSEALSQAIYHADDSFDRGRFDLTDESLNQAIRLAKPPKQRIPVGEILIRPASNTANNSATANQTLSKPNQRVVIVPSRFNNTPIIIVGSQEYEALLKDKENLKQLEIDHNNLSKLKDNIDQDLRLEKENAQKTTVALNGAREALGKKDAVLIKLWIAVVVLIAIIAGSIYLRIKGIL